MMGVSIFLPKKIFGRFFVRQGIPPFSVPGISILTVIWYDRYYRKRDILRGCPKVFLFEHKNTKTHLSRPKKGTLPFLVLMCKVSGLLAL
jgi:hypothetical protein